MSGAFVPVNSSILRVAAVSGFLAVCFGAFGAHSLEALLAKNATAAIWQTAVDYQFFHTLALLVLAFAPLPGRLLMRVTLLWAGGILIFSGSLYILSITGIRWLGAITPIGGVLFLAGWVSLVFSRTKA